MTANEVRDFVVDARDAGDRLDTALATWLGESRSQVARLIDGGDVHVDGQSASRSSRLHVGQRVTVTSPVIETTPPPPVPPIRWEDDDILVIDKPAGLVVHPGSGRPDGTLVDALLAAGMPLAQVGDAERPGIVHRLDLGTSGLMLVAKTVAAHEGLSAALKRREVERRYLAVAVGELPAVTGTIDVPLGRDPRTNVRFIGDHDGKRAVTHWRVLDSVGTSAGPVSLVACRLETGRTHQIRAHLRHVGAPVLGDDRYDGPMSIDELVVTRPLLHAGRIAFTHPVTGESVAVTVEPPADMTAAVHAVGLHLPPVADIWT